MTSSVLLSTLLMMVSISSISPERNFSFVIREGIDKHFSKDSLTCILTDEHDPYPYINEFISSVSKHLSQIVIDKCELYVKEVLNDYYFSDNIIYFNPDLEIQRFIKSDINILLYIELNNQIGINLCEGYLKENLSSEQTYWNIYRRLIVCEYTSPYRTRVSELWVRETWSGKIKRIPNVSAAYFTRKPNLHGTQLELPYDDESPQDKDYIMSIYRSIVKELNAIESEGPVTLLITDKISAFSVEHFWSYSMCVVVHKGDLHPDWQALFWCFHWTLWLGLFVVWVVCGLIWHIHKRNQPLYMSMTEMLQIFVTYPTNWVHSRRINHSRTLTGMLALVSVIVISSLLQSMLFTNLQNPGRFPSIDTLEELTDANIPIHCFDTDSYVYYIFAMCFVNEKLEFLVTEGISINDLYLNSNIAIIQNCESVEKIVNSIGRYRNSLHILKERLIVYSLTMQGMDFTPLPYSEFVFKIVYIYFESGIAQWMDHIQQWKALLKQLLHEERENPHQAFTMKNLQIAFIVLFLGEFLALLVFLIEVFYFYWRQWQIIRQPIIFPLLD